MLGLVLGTLRLPLIVLATGNPVQASGTNIAVSAAAAGAGGLRHAREGRVDWYVVAWMAPPSVAGAIAGALLADEVAVSVLYGVIAAVLAWIMSHIATFLGGFGGVPDLRFVPWVISAFGLGLVAFIVATLGRGVRERVRREVLLPERALARTVDPVAHLRSAEAALGSGRAREAIHELYLYALASLAARELIRYDPALTDRELLLRAAAIPSADALRELVALYERAWFGLREPEAVEAERARTLATRVSTG